MRRGGIQAELVRGMEGEAAALLIEPLTEDFWRFSTSAGWEES